MTQEEKAKAYDKAIERAKKELSTCGSQDCDAARQIFRLFPELIESEDERIRKELISFVKSRLAGFHDCKRFTDWLEKQGQQKHKFNIGDIISNGQVVYRVGDITKNCIGQDCYFLVNVEYEKNGTRYLSLTDLEGKHSNVGEITWLCEKVDKSFEKQGEQKPADKAERKGMNIVEEDMTPFQKKVFCIIDTTIEEEQGLKQVCDELLRLAHDEIKKDSAWSEEDEKIFRALSGALARISANTRTDSTSINYSFFAEIDWLRSLKERVGNFDDGYKVGFSAAKHNQWKPSEEQMAALSDINCTGCISYAGQGQELINLFNDLKRLLKE